MKKNFDLRIFLTENKLTSNSKLIKEEDMAPSPNSNVPDANAEDFDVTTAFKKARVDMSKPVSVRYMSGHAQYATVKVNEMNAEDAIKKIEAERQEVQKGYEEEGMEVPSDIHGYEFENYSVLEKDMPEGHEYKLSYYLGGDYTYAITQEKSGVSEIDADLLKRAQNTPAPKDAADKLAKRKADIDSKNRGTLQVSMGKNAEQEQRVIDIARDAIGLMDEQPGTSAEDALAAVLDI